MSTSTRCRAIDAVLADAVASGAVPNVVAVAADRQGVIYEGAAGSRTPGEDSAVDADTPLRIMSMTKPVVTVAALQLSEQRKLDIDAPVEEYCPEFAAIGLLERIADGRPVLRAPARKVTVKQLITHTSGLGYWFWNADVLAWEQAVGAPKPMTGLRAVLDAPLVAEPGSAFMYSPATDWLGLVVEAVCGRSLDEAITAIITEPLGMTRTGFALDDRARAALVPVHLRAPGGGWAASEIELPSAPEYVSGSRGLYHPGLGDHRRRARRAAGRSPSRRLSGDYLAIVTLFFLELFETVATNGNQIFGHNVTGGALGIPNVNPLSFSATRSRCSTRASSQCPTTTSRS